MTRRKPKTRSVGLRNFTGRVRQNPDGSVSITGIGKRATGKRRNVAAGYVDEEGIFHPLRASYDYSRKRAGEKPKGKKKAKRRKKKNPGPLARLRRRRVERRTGAALRKYVRRKR